MRLNALFWMLFIAAFTCITSCSKDDDDATPTLDRTSITLYVDESTTLKFSGGKCRWSSDDVLIADVEDGVVTAKHVGTTTIHANDLTCVVTVKPQYTTFIEPCMEWGATVSFVKSFMSGYTLKKEDSTRLLYQGKGSVLSYYYSFKDGLLEVSGMMLSLSYATTVIKFLTERYLIGGKYDDTYYFYTLDVGTIISLTVENTGIMVMYMDFTETKSSDAAISTFEAIRQQIKMGSQL